MRKKIISITIICFLTLQFINAQENNHRDSVDIIHYQINMDFSNLSDFQLKGNTILKITAKKDELNSIALDLLELNIDKVFLNNIETKFNYNSSVLRINPDKILTKKDTIELNVYYHGYPQKDKNWGGFFITSSYAFNYGIGMEATPPNFGRVWYPCIDNFTDRATYEYNITVKKEHTAVCPGTLVEINTNKNNTKTYHWKLHNSIPTYLSSIAVADYIAIKDTVKGIERIIPIKIYVNKNDEEKARKSFSHVKSYFHAFENAYGPYVWERIGYVATPFNQGAMEHVTNIAYSANCNGSMSCEYTLAHELSHHWFGDLVTCKTEKDMWLNESWAVFSEAVFEEFMYGKKAYKNYVRENHKKVLQFAHIYDDGYLPLYGIPHEYTYGFTVYKKGGDVVATLRNYLGDSIFFNTLKSYFKDFAFKDISTEEFKNYFSNKSGENLNDFFNFWIYNPGFPHFSVQNYNLTTENNNYVLDFKIVQNLIATDKYLINAKLEIGILDENWKINKYTINFTGKSKIKKLNLKYKPLLFMIDPDEKIADATTDEYLTIKNKGKFEFKTELFNLNVNEISDSAFFRITNNWIKPNCNSKRQMIYELSDNYWEIQYINNDKFIADAEFIYNFSNNTETDFKNPNNEKIVLLYRKNNNDFWKEYKPKIKKEKNFLIANDIINGQYCIALKIINN
ncbi:MAG: M1 family metallopeptidase [Bacteroidales bacterium]|nr:M1 family metallopeptidase [Bacteroidales bacterium]MBN2756125.1 M1 family metallopeptidase [Bacteroidales bacterium]